MALASCADDHHAQPDAMPGPSAEAVAEPVEALVYGHEPDLDAELIDRLYARVGDVSKRRIPVVPGKQPILEIEPRAAGTLHLAAGLPPDLQIDDADFVRCQVRFDNGNSSSVVATLALQGGQVVPRPAQHGLAGIHADHPLDAAPQRGRQIARPTAHIGHDQVVGNQAAQGFESAGAVLEVAADDVPITGDAVKEGPRVGALGQDDVRRAGQRLLHRGRR